MTGGVDKAAHGYRLGRRYLRPGPSWASTQAGAGKSLSAYLVKGNRPLTVGLWERFLPLPRLQR